MVLACQLSWETTLSLLLFFFFGGGVEVVPQTKANGQWVNHSAGFFHLSGLWPA